MSSTSTNSPSQNKSPNPIPILDVIQKVQKLLNSLSKAKDGSRPSQLRKDGKKHIEDHSDGDDENKKIGEMGPSQVRKDGEKDEDHPRIDVDDGGKKEGEMDMHTQLDKACNELSYMIREFEKLKSFEADISTPLETLEDNVNDIVTDLKQDLNESIKKLIERNLKVLRSNITKVKIQIPLQHQVSSAGSDARRYLQTTVASKEGGFLPDPYEAKEIFDIFDGSSFVKEFQDHYKHLDIRLKLCLLCFAIFPENAEVKERLLKFWWSGEKLRPEEKILVKQGPQEEKFVKPEEKNLVKQGPEEKKSFVKQGAEEKNLVNQGPEEKNFVEQTLGKFAENGFIEAVIKKNRSRATSYKMHPIIRALIIKLAKEAIFFDYDSKGNPTMGNPTMDPSASKKSCLVKSEGTTTSCFSKNFLQPKSSDNQQKEKKKDLGKKEQQQQPKSSEEKRKQKELEQGRDKYLANLQTLFNVSTQFPELPEEVFSKMKKIGVLYLGRWERTAERHIEVENTKFLEGLKSMKDLLFFSLQGISGITKLEESVCKLSNLRILDLRACHNLEELPKGIGSLKKLTHLDLSECYLLDIVPKQLSHLSKLKVLKGFVISKISLCRLDHLTALRSLEKLSINVNKDDFSINEAGNVFSKLTALKKLKIAWGAGGKEAPKSTKGNKENNGGKHARRDNSEKKASGNQASSADKSKDQEKQESDPAAKSGVLRKLKIPCGASREETGKIVKTKENGMEQLVKLDLQCFPEREPPHWLEPKKLTSLKRLYIKGGLLSNLRKSSNGEWNVEILRLKFLTDIKASWKELQRQFPKLIYLEKVNCPQITFCPCNANGVWMLKQP
ncbi:hypothetical protein DITRI_Ditri07aG0175200 [Diplodiscus trichospermus]